MKYLIYLSTATKLMQQQDLLDILTISRKNNQARDLTGMLLYSEGAFVQVIEGEDQTVDTVFENIEQDPRHKNIVVIAVGSIDKRNFGDWSMGFKTVNPEVLSQFDGFKPVVKDLLPAEADNKVLIVLKTFAEANRLA